MRYFVLALLGVFSVILSGSFLSGFDAAGIIVDLPLLIIIPLALIEKTSMPIIFAALTGIFMDILFSPVLGVYAIGYTLIAALCALIFRKIIRFNAVSLFLTGAGAYILKECVMAAAAYIMGVRFSISVLFVRSILPSAALNGALLLLSYFLISKLYAKEFMKTRSARNLDDMR